MVQVFIPNLPTRFDQVTQTRIPSIDLNAAGDYGELVPILEGKPNDYTAAFIAIEDRIRETMNPGDFILSVGDVILVAAAINYANDYFGSAKILRWDRQKHGYDVVEVKF